MKKDSANGKTMTKQKKCDTYSSNSSYIYTCNFWLNAQAITKFSVRPIGYQKKSLKEK